MSHDVVSSNAEIESAILAVLVSADSARAGAAALLEALRPVVTDTPMALAVRDRDGIALHVLADAGPQQRWPASLAPRVVVNAEPVVDPNTSTYVIPLQTHGHVCGALMLGDSAIGAELMHGETLPPLLRPVADVLRVLLALTDAEVRRRAVAMRSLDQVVDGMAHQLSNPLTGASALAQLLSEEVSDPDQRAAIEQIRHELSRAFVVVSDLLAFHSDTRAHDGLLDLNAVVERVVRFRSYSIRERGITLEFRTTGEYTPVRVDAQGLEHALLLALQFAEMQSQTSVNRTIDVAVVSRSTREVAVEIRDSGPGRAPDLSPRYFDLSFNNEDRQREPDVQPDLGLVDGILRACGGALEVETSKSAGTRLALVLARAAAPGSVRGHADF